MVPPLRTTRPPRGHTPARALAEGLCGSGQTAVCHTRRHFWWLPTLPAGARRTSGRGRIRLLANDWRLPASHTTRRGPSQRRPGGSRAVAIFFSRSPITPPDIQILPPDSVYTAHRVGRATGCRRVETHFDGTCLSAPGTPRNCLDARPRVLRPWERRRPSPRQTALRPGATRPLGVHEPRVGVVAALSPLTAKATAEAIRHSVGAVTARSESTTRLHVRRGAVTRSSLPSAGRRVLRQTRRRPASL